MTDLQTRCVEAMAREVYEEQRIDHDGIQWELLPKNSYERAALISEARAALTALLAELDAAGWQLVPKEATARMVLAAIDRPADPDAIMYGPIYRAMLASAPKPFGDGE